ncbi:MAG: hypothetical protein ACOX5R_06710 [bacterium]|jgi:hypothetical protein
MNTINNTLANTLYRPVSAGSLQGNLAQYYERTAKYVNEQFHELTGTNVKEEHLPDLKQTDISESERLQPKGLGTLLDITI